MFFYSQFHVLFQTIAYTVRHRPSIVKIVVNRALQRLEKIVITKTVQELLFDGYDDILLKVAVDLNLTKIPYDKFAWFYKVRRIFIEFIHVY